MNTIIALIKREVLEHKNIWRVPLILIGLSLLVRLSLVFGNLSFNVDVPEQLQIDKAIDSALDGVIAGALNSMNSVIMLVMFIVAIFYALSCLYNERQDDSVLFWRSLPISDSITVASKVIVALVLIPLIIIVCQAVLAILFFGTDSISYLSNYYSGSLGQLLKLLAWSLLPTVAWCVLCSEISKKNPFLLAIMAPILLILVDKLFLNGVISQTFIINRLTGFKNFTTMPLIWGALFSAGCISLAIIKRSQRI